MTKSNLYVLVFASICCVCVVLGTNAVRNLATPAEAQASVIENQPTEAKPLIKGIGARYWARQNSVMSMEEQQAFAMRMHDRLARLELRLARLQDSVKDMPGYEPGLLEDYRGLISDHIIDHPMIDDVMSGRASLR